MNAKEKAKDLVNWYYENLPQWVNTDEAKMCATKCVNEIINVIEFMAESDEIDKLPYWNETLKEIELIKYGNK
jgi:hypothetical protein